MQKLAALVAFLLLAIATPVIATQDNNNSSNGDCNPNADWGNHGQYVSCVAHTHPGGQVVSEAARSDVGKKNGVEPSPSSSPAGSPSPSPATSPSPTPSVLPTPSVSPSATPEVSPSSSPSISPEPSPSASPELTVVTAENEGDTQLARIIEKLEQLLERLQNLLGA